MNKFKTGDRVITIEDCFFIKKGAKGTVLEDCTIPAVKLDDIGMVINTTSGGCRQPIHQDKLQLLNQNTMQPNIQQQIAVLEKDLAALKRIASEPQQPSFFSLKTIKDVREKVKPQWFTAFQDGTIHCGTHHWGYDMSNSYTPSEADAKSVAAFRDLLCLCAADDSEVDSEVTYWYIYNGKSGINVSFGSAHSPIKFKSQKSAQHALDNFPHLFKAYLKV